MASCPSRVRYGLTMQDDQPSPEPSASPATGAKATEPSGGGSESTPAALIAACERLCSATPPSEVSVRDIAAEANVTPGLVHHYFDSKDALVGATLRHIAAEIDETASEAPQRAGDPEAMVRAAWRFMQQRPAFAFIVAWWLLEGRDVTEAMREHPFLRRLAATLPGTDEAGRATTAGVIVSLLIGGTVFRAGVNRALGRPLDDAALPEALETAVADLAGRG
jgi:AcrR family transcriptional regulator